MLARIRNALLAGVLLFLAAATVEAQSPRSTLLQVERRTALRVHTAALGRIQGGYSGMIRDTLVLRENEVQRHLVPVAQIDSIWQLEVSSSGGSRIGGIIGAVVVGGASAAIACRQSERCGTSAVAAGLVGALLGTFPGSVIGSIVGGVARRWELLYP